MHLEGFKILGKPLVFGKCYFENRAYELIFMDDEDEWKLRHIVTLTGIDD